MANFWDKCAGIYDFLQTRINGKVYDAMLEYIREEVPDGADVLECAAGTGAISLNIADKANSLLCTDISSEMLDIARKKAQHNNIHNIRFELGDIMSAADDGRYDIIIAANVLFFLDEPQEAVRVLCRAAKNGGKVIIPLFLLDGLNTLLRLYDIVGLRFKNVYNVRSYADMLRGAVHGRMKIKLIRGRIPMAIAVIYK